jgi:thioredoxin reductase (NADPH)
MSAYLCRRIEDDPKIVLHRRTQVVALAGHDCLERVTWRSLDSGEESTVEIRHLFSMLGALPNSHWLDGCVVLDSKGFVKTGPDLSDEELQAASWHGARPPVLFETSRPGVFAVGDVRAGSVKRVAAAVGEGSGCVQLLHRALAGTSVVSNA